MRMFERFVDSSGPASVSGQDTPVFARVFKNVAIAAALATSAIAASAATPSMPTATSGMGGECAAGAEFMQARSMSGPKQAQAFQALSGKMTPALMTGLRVFQNAVDDQRDGIERLTTSVLDAKNASQESAARDAMNAAKAVGFVAAGYKAAGAVQAEMGAESAQEVVRYLAQCNASSDELANALQKASSHLNGATTAPTLKQAQAVAAKTAGLSSPASSAGVKMLQTYTDFSHEGEALKPLPGVAQFLKSAPTQQERSTPGLK